LFCKYCKEGESVFTHFRAHINKKFKEKEKRENAKNKKNVGIKKKYIYIYINEKSIQECLGRLIEEDQIYKIEKFDSDFQLMKALLTKKI
jgi:hypothetical protein